VLEEARDEVKTVLCGLLGGKLKDYEYHENPILSREGKQHHIIWHNTVLHNEQGQIEGILSSGEDVTERREAEEAAKLAYTRLEQANKELKEMHSQMVQSEKLASIGQLAAGVAHEMNTPVGFVASNFHTLESYIKKFRGLLEVYDGFIGAVEGVEKAELLSKIEDVRKSREDMNIDFILEDIQGLFNDSKEGLSRVTTIIENLKDFSRVDQAEDFDEYDINSGIEATLVVARNEVKYDVDLKTELSEVPAVFCNSSQVNQVFLNLLLNAAQAIKSQKRDEHGTITIKTYSTEADVVCEIVDDGPGIAAENLSKIFDPFFTTKPAGSGTGLGLSVSYDIIVSKHKGQLLADSTVGKGTKFTIKLPINSQAADNQKAAGDSREFSYTGNTVKEQHGQRKNEAGDHL
jgi:signal transduction histidine kinase